MRPCVFSGFHSCDDIGMWTGYAMAHDQSARIECIALGEALIPGVSASPPLLPDQRWLSDFLWHFNFNRALGINEQLVSGREEFYFGHQFATKAGSPEAVPRYAVDFYIEQLKRDPQALRASFDYYRAIDQSIPQNQERKATRLTLPVLAFSGALAPFVTHAMPLERINETFDLMHEGKSIRTIIKY